MSSEGRALPLRNVLPEEYRNGSWNISISIAPLANLTRLGNKSFNLDDWSGKYLWDLSQSGWVSWLSEVIAQTIQFSTYFMFIIPFFMSFKGKERPHFLAMVHRICRAQLTAHILRVPTYLSTQIPGVAPHCQSVRWSGPQPRGGYEVNQ